MTTPVFIVSSGRSGSAMMDRLFRASPEIAMHHEYAVQIVQPLAARLYMGLVDRVEARRVLADTYGAALAYATTPLWGDSSNKLAWLIEPLNTLFPKAKFVHLVRDGRKVASSYFHKLGDECYDDRSTAALAAHIADPLNVPAPPPEKKYWWPLARRDDPHARDFARFDQFSRIAWHWSASNREILKGLTRVAPERQLRIKLEILREDRGAFDRFMRFIGLEPDAERFAMMQRPHNVNRPEDRLLTAEQAEQFRAVAWDMMERFGYDAAPEYAMAY